MTATCPEGRCTNPVVVEREDGRCYFHGKVQDALMDRPERKGGGGRPREYVDVGGGRLVEVSEWEQVDARLGRSVDVDHDVADLLPRLDVPVRLDDLVQADTAGR